MRVRWFSDTFWYEEGVKEKRGGERKGKRRGK